MASRDAVKTYNPKQLGDLPAIIQTLLRGSGLSDGRVVDMMPSYTEELAAMLRPETLPDWQLWATWHILVSRAGVLPEEVGAANFEFYGTALSVATQQRDRWKRGIALAKSLVGEDMGKAFVDKHCSLFTRGCERIDDPLRPRHMPHPLSTAATPTVARTIRARRRIHRATCLRNNEAPHQRRIVNDERAAVEEFIQLLQMAGEFRGALEIVALHTVRVHRARVPADVEHRVEFLADDPRFVECDTIEGDQTAARRMNIRRLRGERGEREFLRHARLMLLGICVLRTAGCAGRGGVVIYH